MRLVCAMLVSGWRFEPANIFAPLRERYLKLDTIPKPRGLDSGGPRSGLSVRSLSGLCPGIVRELSGER
jgi:hypothetical protein